MGYSAEVISRARQKLAAEKEDAESQYRRNLEAAYTRVPRLREIDRMLRMTMAKAVQGAFLNGNDGEQALASAREQNQQLRAERNAIVQKYLPEGFLEKRNICGRCGSTGYIGAEMCECLQALCRMEQRSLLGKLGSGMEGFSDFRLGYYPNRTDPGTGVNIRALMDRTFQICRNYGLNFSLNAGNLLLSGDTGLGKTYLSSCIAYSAADRGYSVIYESAPELFLRMERARFSGDAEAQRQSESYHDCDLLILDDLGTEMAGQFVNASLYAVINQRMMNKLPMIISTNLTSEEMERRYSPQIASRLRGGFRRVPFLGEDIRLLKNKGVLL